MFHKTIASKNWVPLPPWTPPRSPPLKPCYRRGFGRQSRTAVDQHGGPTLIWQQEEAVCAFFGERDVFVCNLIGTPRNCGVKSTAWIPQCCQALFPSRVEIGMEIGTGYEASAKYACSFMRQACRLVTSMEFWSSEEGEELP